MPLEYALQFRGRYQDPGPWKLPRSFSVRPSTALGISDLPVQRLRRSKNRPYVYNIMVVGESGLGKTTFMNTLFNAPLNEEINPKQLAGKTMEITPTTYEINEDGVVLHLTVVDTPGFGDALNREQNFEPIIEYIEAQYESFLKSEQSQEMRRNIRDTRIHTLLYFLPPTGISRLKDLDVEFLQRLCTKVNIVPVIAKADTLTGEEIANYKRAILRDFERFDIRVYPTAHAEDREEISHLERLMPFSVIGSDSLVAGPDGKMTRGRMYKWGSVQVENEAHCDFVSLRHLLIRTNLQDLIDTTHGIHYAAYRSGKIREKGRPESFLACDEYYDSRIENAKRSLTEEMQKKEDEMRQMFVSKVREKEASLREREEKLNEKRQAMMQELEALRKAVEVEEAAVQELTAARKLRR